MIHYENWRNIGRTPSLPRLALRGSKSRAASARSSARRCCASGLWSTTGVFSWSPRGAQGRNLAHKVLVDSTMLIYIKTCWLANILIYIYICYIFEKMCGSVFCHFAGQWNSNYYGSQFEFRDKNMWNNGVQDSASRPNPGLQHSPLHAGAWREIHHQTHQQSCWHLLTMNQV